MITFKICKSGAEQASDFFVRGDKKWQRNCKE